MYFANILKSVHKISSCAPPEAGKGVSEQRGHGGGPHLSGEYSCRYLYSASRSSVLKTLALLNPCHLSTSRSFVDRSQNH